MYAEIVPGPVHLPIECSLLRQGTVLLRDPVASSTQEPNFYTRELDKTHVGRKTLLYESITNQGPGSEIFVQEGSSSKTGRKFYTSPQKFKKRIEI
jgi:hypothetical protein